MTIANIKRGRKPKYLHTIYLDVNAREVYKKYRQTKKEETPINVQNVNPQPQQPQQAPQQQVEKDDTSLIKKKKYSTPQIVNKHITLLDYIQFGCLPERTDLACAHCRHTFETCPIGIPIRYMKKKPEKFTGNVITGTNDYFFTSNIVCSFPCALAFINANNTNAFYRQSKSLIYSLYFKLYNTELNVKPAPSWECLQLYGGTLSINEFREAHCTSVYKITPNIKRPFMVSVGKFIEERQCGL
jgi:hypothetical protein